MELTKQELIDIIDNKLLRHGESVSGTNSKMFFYFGEKLDKISSDVSELKVDMSVVKEQTLKTNGRVTRLEGKVEALEIIGATNKGKMYAFGIVIIAVGSFVSGALQNLVGNFLSK